MQPQLLPDEKPEPCRHNAFKLADLPPSDALVGPEPTPQFIATVRAVGVLTPIVCRERPDGRIVVDDGRRRIKAARATGLETIPANVYPADWARGEVVSLLLNQQRSENVATEYHSIIHLMDAGFSKEQICTAIGISKQRVQRLLRLGKLTPALMLGFLEGKIAPGVAIQATSLRARQKFALEKILEETGRVRGKDVKAARRKQHEDAAAQLSHALFDTPSAADISDSREASIGEFMERILACGWELLVQPVDTEVSVFIIRGSKQYQADATTLAEGLKEAAIFAESEKDYNRAVLEGWSWKTEGVDAR